MIKLKRVYEEPAEGDGLRILVERLWPRGFTKERARIGLWLKEVAPSPELRKWFGHDPAKWEEFRKRYLRERRAHPDEIRKLREKMRQGMLTIVFGSKEERFNNANALKEYLESHQ